MTSPFSMAANTSALFELYVEVAARIDLALRLGRRFSPLAFSTVDRSTLAIKNNNK